MEGEVRMEVKVSKQVGAKQGSEGLGILSGRRAR